jgi:hypothetical protein
MDDKLKEAQVDISGKPTLIVLNGIFYVEGHDGNRAELGNVTHKMLDNFKVAVDRLNQHLFPQNAAFDVNAFLAKKECTND